MEYVEQTEQDSLTQCSSNDQGSRLQVVAAGAVAGLVSR